MPAAVTIEPKALGFGAALNIVSTVPATGWKGEDRR